MVSVRYRTNDVIITVGSVWDSQHGNQSGTTRSDFRIDSTVREEMAAQARQVRPPLLSHTWYYLDKRDWHEDTYVLFREDSKERYRRSPNRIKRNTASSGAVNATRSYSKRPSPSDTEYEIARVRGDTTPPTLCTRIFRDLRTPTANIGYICVY